MGKSIDGKLRAMDRRVVTVDIVVDVVEGEKPFQFATDMPEYREIIDQIQEESLASRRARAQKKKSAKEDKEEPKKHSTSKRSKSPGKQ